MIRKVFYLIFLTPFLLHSQLDVNLDSITNNSIGINNLNFEKWSSNKEAVVFFCPKGLVKDSDYINSLNFYKEDLRFKQFKGRFTLVFYREDDVNNSKNPFISNIFSRDSIINQLQCFIITNKAINVNRSKSLLKKNYIISVESSKYGIYKLDLIDLACPKNLATKTSLYLDFINEVFFPKYSYDELIEMLQKRILILENEMTNLKSEFNNYKKELNAKSNSNLKDSNSESSDKKNKKSKCKEEEE